MVFDIDFVIWIIFFCCVDYGVDDIVVDVVNDWVDEF